MTVRAPIRLMIRHLAAEHLSLHYPTARLTTKALAASAARQVTSPLPRAPGPRTDRKRHPRGRPDPTASSRPDLHAILYQTAVHDLRQFNEGANYDRTGRIWRRGSASLRQSIVLGPAAQTARLFSPDARDYRFCGQLPHVWNRRRDPGVTKRQLRLGPVSRGRGPQTDRPVRDMPKRTRENAEPMQPTVMGLSQVRGELHPGPPSKEQQATG
jgi:hypothetical protein